jgi:alcohol/geraniol dehydrogenase (NADP+)
MTDKFVGYQAKSAGAKFEQAEFDAGVLHPEHVEIDIKYGGVCHSDLSMLDNDWGITQYPFVGGHEAIGTICRIGDQVKNLKVGQTVGVGWNVESCMHCQSCMSGSHQMCAAVQPTIIHHHGGFANKLRAHWGWTIPIPEGVDPASAGPLMCGGITVFGPLYECNIRPTDKVAVIGIGGLGHMALKFARAWGCEVTAFTSSPSKFDEAKRLGAHNVLATHDKDALNKAASSFDMILVTANAPLEWDALINCLKPKGRLHIVGAVTEPIPVKVTQLISRGNSVSASPTGSPSAMTKMLEFAGRHKLAPQVEHFPMSKINDAFDHLKSGKARYRIVLDADF